MSPEWLLKMSFEEFKAFCLGTVVSQSFAEQINVSEAKVEQVIRPPIKQQARTRDVLFKAHIDETKLEERKFEKDQKAINRERLIKARAEREAREAALAKAMEEERIKKDEEEKKLKAALKLNFEKKKKKEASCGKA